jgi:molybdopterin-containing oxidoreductase family iron-sulfur binding subunit
MKRILQHPVQPVSGKKYWRSLEQLRDTPEFRGWLEREFPRGAAEFSGGDVSRRNFLQLMGASMALAGLSFAGCRRPEKHLIPFTRGVEWSIPGKALFYTTAMPTRRGYAPLVATTHDGRPTKIEGNPCTRRARARRTSGRKLRCSIFTIRIGFGTSCSRARKDSG